MSPATAGEMREIRGPAAVSGGWRRFFSLLWVSAVSDFRTRYAGSRLGYLWALLRPLALFGILYVVVTEILGSFADDIDHYAVLLLFNIELFQFFAEATAFATGAMVRTQLVRKMTMPQLVLPIASVLTTSFSFLCGMVIVLIWIAASGVDPTWTWLLLPLVIVTLFVFTCAVAMLLSSLYVKFRDVAQIWPMISRVLFYLTPVIFPIETIPRGVLTTMEVFNPLAPIFVQARVWVIDPDAPDWFEFADNPVEAIMPFVIFVGTCVAAWVVFSRRARKVAEEI